MKKIINGKLYNTGTAEKVGLWSNGRSTRDFRCVYETLYRKKTGEYFLHGEGGAMTTYAENVGDMRGWGERIYPMTYDEARSWAENKLDADEYEAIFGEVAEDDSITDFNCRIPASTVEKLKRAASKAGKTQVQLLVEWIDTL